MKKYDILVAGGGFAGIGAAAAAASLGKSVLLVEKGGCLGGAAANALVLPFMPYSTLKKNSDGSSKRIFLVRGIFEEITDMLTLKNAGDKYYFNTDRLKTVLDEFVTAAGVDVLFHTSVYSVNRTGRWLDSVSVTSVGGSFSVEASYFIDATGDANLSYLAGCGCKKGRETDNLCQPMTLCFRVSGAPYDEVIKCKDEMNRLYAEKRGTGEIKNPREDILLFKTRDPNIIHFNTTRVVKLDPTDPVALSAAEMAARRQMVEMVDFLKANFPVFKNADIVCSAPEIGVRESRMVNGEHLLTGKELVELTKFPDAVAAGNYDIDIHNPEGEGTSHYYFPAGEYYTIPLGSLIAKDADNLFIAGRCISCDHEAQASIRIMPICCATGHAAGAAAAVAVDMSCTAKDVDINKVQHTIKAQNGFF